MEDKYNLYDEVISVTLVNFMIEDARNGDVVLTSFDPENVNHLYSFEVALLLSQSINKVFYLDMDILPYWKFRFMNWSLRTSFKRYTSKNKSVKMELDSILRFIIKDKSLDRNIYEEIYKEYYEQGTKNRSIYRRKRKK